MELMLRLCTGDPMFSNILIWVRTGDPMFSSILSAVNSRMGSIALVHVEDICSAHMFLMEHARAEGRYICSARSCVMSELVDHLAKEYPFSNSQRYFFLWNWGYWCKKTNNVFSYICLSIFRCTPVEEEHGSVPSEISSKKLRDLGFSFKYGLEDIMNHTVNSSVDCGFLYPNVKLDWQFRHRMKQLSETWSKKNNKIQDLQLVWRSVLNYHLGN